MQFPTRLIVILCLAVTAAILALVAVTHVAFDRLNVDQVRARTGFVIGTLKSGIEANVALGLPLADVAVAQDLIDRQRAADPSVVAIDVLGPDARTLFSTDRGVVGEPAPPAWARALEAAGTGSWAADDGGQLVFGAPIDVGIGRPVGEVAVALSATEQQERGAALTADLIEIGLAALAAALAAAIVAGLALGHALLRPFRSVAAILAGRPAGGAIADGALAAVASAAAASRDLEAATAAMRTLEDVA